MKQNELISLFCQLNKALIACVRTDQYTGYQSGITENEWNDFQFVVNRSCVVNPWFTKENTKVALEGIIQMTEKDALQNFVSNYSFTENPKKIALVMAGNLPLVGFHDFLCVLLSGNKVLCKLSSEDSLLPNLLFSWLISWSSEMEGKIEISFGPMKHFDAVIATGSNNTLSYFQQYFGHVPHIFRRSRTSVAVLDGSETDEELKGLMNDVFLHFGKGCRNVSKVFLPETFSLDRLFENSLHFSHIVNHHKYANNYDYNRTIFLMNSVPFLDNNVFMLKEDESLHAPLSVIYYQKYTEIKEVDTFLSNHSEAIQAIVGHGYIPFGSAQSPELNDFADGVDTMLWLNSLNS